MTRADWFAIMAAIVMLPMLYAHFWTSTEPARFVKLIHGKNDIEELSLATDRQIEFAGDLGISTLEIKHGKVRFIASPCHAKVCIHSGWIHNTGQILACLPNGVLVELEGGTNEFDAINF